MMLSTYCKGREKIGINQIGEFIYYRLSVQKVCKKHVYFRKSDQNYRNGVFENIELK